MENRWVPVEENVEWINAEGGDYSRMSIDLMIPSGTEPLQ
jgi:hypothetical protein